MGTLDGKVAVVARTYEGDEGVVATAKEIEAVGARALPIQCDVCQTEQFNRSVGRGSRISSAML